MAEEKGISIPDDILNDLRKVSQKEQAEEKESFPLGGMSDVENEKPDLEHFMKLVKWGANSFDNVCKANNLPGLGKVSPEEFSEITKIWIEYEGFERLAENSPRFLFGGVLITIISSNAIGLRKIQKAGKKEQESDK